MASATCAESLLENALKDSQRNLIATRAQYEALEADYKAEREAGTAMLDAFEDRYLQLRMREAEVQERQQVSEARERTIEVSGTLRSAPVQRFQKERTTFRDAELNAMSTKALAAGSELGLLLRRYDESRAELVDVQRSLDACKAENAELSKDNIVLRVELHVQQGTVNAMKQEMESLRERLESGTLDSKESPTGDSKPSVERTDCDHYAGDDKNASPGANPTCSPQVNIIASQSPEISSSHFVSQQALPAPDSKLQRDNPLWQQRQTYFDFMARFPRPASRRQFRYLKPIQLHGGSARALTAMKEKSSLPTVMLEKGGFVWCAPDQRLHVLAFTPAYVLHGYPRKWVPDTSLASLVGKKISIVVQEIHCAIYYAGTYLVHDMRSVDPVNPNGRFPDGVSSRAILKAMGLDTAHNAEKVVDPTCPAAGLHAGGRPRTLCFGLQCVGFDDALYDHLLEEFAKAKGSNKARDGGEVWRNGTSYRPAQPLPARPRTPPAREHGRWDTRRFASSEGSRGQERGREPWILRARDRNASRG
ncbi:hypothetical protein MKEN_00471900 [Mycena kentingensis (nom. inval.)]|nr:hypothetical protein MKEN_00471900 [Mycena kentingensis (nom. inval.)]